MSNDNELSSIRFSQVWWDNFHTQRLTARYVILTAMEGGDATSILRSALSEIAPSVYPNTYSPHKLGRWLARAKDRQIISTIHLFKFTDRGPGPGGRAWQLSRELASERAMAEASLPEEFLDAVAG